MHQPVQNCQMSKRERFAKTVNDYKPLTIFAKRSILYDEQGSEYASVIIIIIVNSALAKYLS